MISNTLQCDVIASNLHDPTAIQLNEQQNTLFVLNGCLVRVDLNATSSAPQLVYQHNRKLHEMDTGSDDGYSQGESDDDKDVPRVSDPYDDSEPSTDDDEETIENRRNWRRHGWRTYQLDNPCSILFLPEDNRLIVLNEGVITFLTVELESGRPFVQGPSRNIFCYDFDAFKQEDKMPSVQPWSIAFTSQPSLFVFSLLNSAQLYSLDVSNETATIKKLITTPVFYCPYLLFHRQSNTLFVYDPTQIVVVSLNDETTAQLTLPDVSEQKKIGAMAVDKAGYIYILVGSTIFKYAWGPQLELIERLETTIVLQDCTSMVVNGMGTEFYLSNVDTGCVDRWKKEST